MSLDSTENAQPSRSDLAPPRKPFGLWVVQAYFSLMALLMVGMAARLAADPAFPHSVRVTLATCGMVLVWVCGIVASQFASRRSRAVVGTVLVLSIGLTLYGHLAEPKPDPAFDHHRPDIQGAAERTGAAFATVVSLAVPICLLAYVFLSRNVRTFLGPRSIAN